MRRGVAVRRQDAEQQARVERLGTRVPYVAVFLRGEAPAFDELLDRLRLPAPVGGMARRDQAAFGEVPRPIEGDPTHHLRRGEVLGFAAHLPDPGIGPPPDPADEIGCLGQPLSDVTVYAMPAGGVEPSGLEELAVGIEL